MPPPYKPAAVTAHHRRIVELRQYARELNRLGKGTGFRTSLKVGIFGGSFDPVHAGHIAIAKYASKNLSLGRVFWVLAQASPAKDSRSQNKGRQSSFDERLALARQALGGWQTKVPATESATENVKGNVLAQNVSAIEKKLNITHTHELAEALTKAFPKLNLVFLMGADSFVQFKSWRKWRRLAKYMTLAVFARKGSSLQARLNGAGKRLPRVKQGWMVGRRIVEAKPPRWAFLPMQNVMIASSAMRDAENQRVEN